MHIKIHTLEGWLAHCERLHPHSIDLGLQRVGEVARRMAERLDFIKLKPTDYLDWAPGLGDSQAALAAAYAEEPFLTVLPFGEAPATRHVRGSNFVHVGVIPELGARSWMPNCARASSPTASACTKNNSRPAACLSAHWRCTDAAWAAPPDTPTP